MQLNHERTLKEAWERYRHKIIPEKVGVIQIQESRRAFYAGAISGLVALSRLEKEIGLYEAAERLKQELNAFVNLVRQDKDTDI